MIQVYTGTGKGKTTAALGLAIRAAGAGLKVYIAQFTKGRQCSELNSLKRFRNIKVEQFGRCGFIRKITPADKALAVKGIKRVKDIIKERTFDILILDELNVALDLKLLETTDVLKLLKKAPRRTELVLTGRNAPSGIVKIADLVSEIKEIRHYYHKGLIARKGIEF